MPFNLKFFSRPGAIIGSCVGTLIIILAAGLWPFHSPVNDVTWLADEDGIQIGRFGCVLSSSPLRDHGFSDVSSGSIELWIKPARATKGRRTILSIEGPGDDSTALALQQSGNSLIIQRKNSDEGGIFHTAEFAIKDALVDSSRVGITLTMGPQDTTVYRNGVPAAAARFIGTPATTFAGRVMLANSLNTGGAWPGKFYGLAIYSNKLTAEEVASHFEDMGHSRRSTITQEEHPVVLYLFTERTGSVVRDSLGSGNNLIIPERYSVLHPEFLTPPWRHFRSTPGYWEDVAINIFGFVPLGLTFLAYFSTIRPTRNSGLLVLFLGFLISLTIEVLQAWLPTRNSGMNDLITNTLGTGLGILLYRTCFVRAILGSY